jgi:IS30 family transposase
LDVFCQVHSFVPCVAKLMISDSLDVDFLYFTPFQRSQIVRMHETGLSFREIARRLSRCDSTIIPACRAWSNGGSERCRKGSGRSGITNERKERRLRRLASVNPFETTRSVEVTWRIVLERQVSMRTIYALLV